MVKNGKGEIESLKPTENLKRWGGGGGGGGAFFFCVHNTSRGVFF